MSTDTAAQTTAATTIEANKALVHRYYAELVTGQRIELLEELVAADAADETRVGPGGAGTREDFAEHLRVLWETVEGVTATVEDLVAEGDRVIAFWRIEGKHVGHVFGVPATGRDFVGHSISTLTIKDGRVVRYNVLPDRLGIIRQLTPALV
ncbi:ester cyclase [Kitasatospora sp. NBC_01287]|uniref:ester cyclase n=1 Tax=Kitasatospora sp. NBC_01287 TaxID=2903573 RepID=UPI00224DC985|nr:ester cyclase [Kitasatospora sp. NBC_01287]MCX4745007.1 ester cyclase [Kitasatospora sp. NBC_01287]